MYIVNVSMYVSPRAHARDQALPKVTVETRKQTAEAEKGKRTDLVTQGND